HPPRFLGGTRRDPTRHDLAALGYVTLQEPDVLVVDLRGIGAGKRTGLAAAKEWPAGLRRGKRHGRHSSVAPPGGDSSSRPSLGGRPSRSRARARPDPPPAPSRKPPPSPSRKPNPPSPPPP